MAVDLSDLCAFAAGYSLPALRTAIAAALETQIPAEEERNGMASLVAAWLREPEGDPPPLGDAALTAIYRQLTPRVH